MTLIIQNVKEEYLSAFKGLAEGTNATLEVEGEDECPICKQYGYKPNDELIEAIKEFERGEVVRYDSVEEMMKDLQ